jgi:hypothetical protein
VSTLDFAMNFEDNQQADADKKLFVIFYKDAIKNEFKSTEAGRPIFDELDLVKIMTPGSRDTFVGDATEQYQKRFPDQWARYKAGQDQSMSGTPLNVLPWLSIAQIAEFKAMSCHTVEQLVSIPDNVSQKFMGYHGIKQRAQQYLDAAKDSAPLLKMEAELQKRDEQIAELKATVDAMMAAKKAENTAKVPAKA